MVQWLTKVDGVHEIHMHVKWYSLSGNHSHIMHNSLWKSGIKRQRNGIFIIYFFRLKYIMIPSKESFFNNKILLKRKIILLLFWTICMYIFLYKILYIYMYIHTYIHIYMCIYICICIPRIIFLRFCVSHNLSFPFLRISRCYRINRSSKWFWINKKRFQFLSTNISRYIFIRNVPGLMIYINN